MNLPAHVIKLARAPFNSRFAILVAFSEFPVISLRLISGMCCKTYAAVRGAHLILTRHGGKKFVEIAVM